MEEGTEEYIEMDVSNAAFSGGESPPHASEFEFCMPSTAATANVPVTSPADELFYKGKLLPLHLPPRLQMVQLLLAETNGGAAGSSDENLRCLFTKPSRKATEEYSGHRRSFTGVINHRPSLNSSSSPSASTPSSSSSSSSSLKRSSSANSEVECSIQGAIAYCKKSSEQAIASRKSFGDVGCCALSHSKVAAAG